MAYGVPSSSVAVVHGGIVSGGPLRMRLGPLGIGTILAAQALAGRMEAERVMIEVVVWHLGHGR